MISPSLLANLGAAQPASSGGGGGTPGAPDNPQAAAALSAMIVAGHAFLRTERDPMDRAAVTQCLAKLESLRGKKMPGAQQGGSGGGQSSGGSSGY
jgi:hypothetical protein